YFAPLMAAYLKRLNYSNVCWFSIRPKNGTSIWERLQLRKLRGSKTRVLLVDDYPATGGTLRLTLKILYESKLRPEQISILAPTHAAKPDWIELANIDPRINTYTVQPDELFKVALLKPESVESWCREYFTSGLWPVLRIVSDARTAELNARLA